MLTDLKNRGLKDILIACVDGLTGFPQAIEAVYPDTQVQLCIVHNCPRSAYRDYFQRLQRITHLPTERNRVGELHLIE